MLLNRDIQDIVRNNDTFSDSLKSERLLAYFDVKMNQFFKQLIVDKQIIMKFIDLISPPLLP